MNRRGKGRRSYWGRTHRPDSPTLSSAARCGLGARPSPGDDACRPAGEASSRLSHRECTEQPYRPTSCRLPSDRGAFVWIVFHKRKKA